uniref:SAM domain-containing protein n=1 Tax=Glossina austeni TaxID=7395 RepID=A0A1A9VEK5_GLOAU
MLVNAIFKLIAIYDAAIAIATATATATAVTIHVDVLCSKRKTAATSENTTTTTTNSYLPTQPLKDNSNIRIIKVNAEQAHLIEQQKQQQQLVSGTTTNPNNNCNSTPLTNTTCKSTGSPTSATIVSINGTHKPNNNGSCNNNERPLKCLETLAQKAGITFDEKYDFASPPHPGSASGGSVTYSIATTATQPSVSVTGLTGHAKSFTLEKAQSPAQQVAPGAVPLQISPEQLQQLQQLHQLQHGSPFAAIQVKQEFPTHTTTATLTGPSGAGTELKHSGLLDAATAQGQLQQMQMQLAAAAADAGGGGTPNSPATQQTPSSAAAAVAAMQQHSTTISTMSPMQLATTTGQVAAAGDWAQGRTVQLMQPSTGFLYPHMLVPGNLIQSGLGQQPIQVITAGKPFQGGAPQMITTTQNTKQMAIGGNTGFPSGTTYAIPSSQSPQTLLFSPVNVISQSPQPQNILQAMAAASNAQQQQQQQQQQKGAIESQKNMQPKVMQKLTTTTTNSVQSASGGGVGQQQQQPTTQQCVQVNTQTGMPTGTTQIISPLQGTTGAPQPLQINAAPWVQSVPFWPNGLQQLQNPIIIRGTQPDGTQGVFIQQPTGQTLQAQQPNQITLQCNVTQAATKARNQLEQITKQQQQSAGTAQQVVQQQQPTTTQLQQVQQHPHQQVAAATAAVAAQQQQQQQQAVVAAHLQAAAVLSQRTPAAQMAMAQNGNTQIRPASSVSTQTAQNQTMASMMNAAAGGGSATLTSTSSVSSVGTTITTTTVPTSIASSSMSHQNTASASLPSTPNKVAAEQVKAVSSAPNTPTTVALTASLSAPSTPSSCNESNQKETPPKVIGTEANRISSSEVTLTTTTLVSSMATGTPAAANNNSLPEIPQQIVTPIDTTPVSEPSSEHQLTTKTQQQIQASTTSPVTVTANTPENSTSPAKSIKSTSESDSMTSTAIVVSTTPEDTGLSASVGTTIAANTAPIIATSSVASTTSSSTFVTNNISTTTSTTTTNTINLKSISTSSVPSKPTTGANVIKAEKDLPKAMIKPNVLTHVIDGFIIQEANEPFPVTRQRYTDRESSDEPPKKKLALDDSTINNNNNNSLSSDLLSSDMVACEQCGKPEHKAKLKKKRFCSPSCARLAKNSAGEQGLGQVVQQQSVDNSLNNSNITAIVTSDNINGNNLDINTNNLVTANIGVNVEKMQTESTSNSASTMVAPNFANNNLSANLPIAMTTSVSEVGAVPQISAAPIVENTPQMANWSVADVCEFIKNLPGCSDYVDDFEQQEIDGQALLLLKENHLVNAMGMKLGPALKIVAKVESMKEVTTAALNAANNSPNENNQQ